MGTVQVILIALAALSLLLGLALFVRSPAEPLQGPKPVGGRDPAGDTARALLATTSKTSGGQTADAEGADLTLLTVRMDLERIRVDDVGGGRDDDGEDLFPVARAHRFVADTEAARDVPTLTTNAFLVSAARQTDAGTTRAKNEDRFLTFDDEGVYFVADGMGGYAGGDVASQTAVDTIEEVFRSHRFETRIDADLPRRATELAQAMQAANLAIWDRASNDPALRGMGTTLVGARFALNKTRMYIGHIGDSRCYRLRQGTLEQLTQDHTLAAAGVPGSLGSRLVRAAGVAPEVEIDLIIAEPKIGDVYLFCSDGLNKMVPDDRIEAVLVAHAQDLRLASLMLVNLANERGGKDNITVVLVGVRPPPKTHAHAP